MQQNITGDSTIPPIKAKKKHNIYRTLIIAIVSTFLASATYVVATAFMRSNPTFNPQKHLIEFQQTLKDPGQLAFGDKERVLILCLGLDENRDERGIGYTKGSRTDTIFILNLDKKGQRIGILSIPRDTYIDMGEKWGHGKINSVYSEAFWEEYEKNGHDHEKAKMAAIMQTRKTISDFLGVQIDYYALIRIQASRQLVDAIGGITVDVEKDMDYDDNWGKLHIHLQKGRQKLDGTQVVGYARFRHDEEGDWGRIRRQQQVIDSLTRELKKPVHIMHINKLARIVKENLDTDMDLGQLVDLANVYRSFNPKNIAKGVITGSDDWAGGGMIIVPGEDEKKRLVARILKSPSDILPEDIRVRVWNRDASQAQVDWVVNKLKKDGYVVMEVTDIPWPPEKTPEPSPEVTEEPSPETSPDGTPSPRVSPEPIPTEAPYELTEIVDHFGNLKARRMLEAAIKFYRARSTQKACDNREAPSDFTVILAKDYYQMPDDPLYTPPPPPKLKLDEGPGTFEVHTSPAPE